MNENPVCFAHFKVRPVHFLVTVVTYEWEVNAKKGK